MKNNIFTFLLFLSCSISIFGQNLPSLLIDNVSTQFSNVSLPYWMKAGQTINIGTNAKSVSILEFTVNGSSLEFSQAISLTSLQTVPSNKVWKVEAIGLVEINTFIPSISGLSNSSSNSTSSNLPTIFQSPKKFETVGAFTWNVPPGVTTICIEAWGGGGGGGNVTANRNSGGGGGGGYGYACYNVVPGTIYTITVGAGGSSSASGGSSSVGNLISVSGGNPGSAANNCISAAGGDGGTSNASFSIVGETGGVGTGCPVDTIGFGGKGGKGGNGGEGGGPVGWSSNGAAGIAPGGGGGGVWTAPHVNNTPRTGGSGARGQVFIYF